MDVIYTAVATARGGREGEVVSDDGILDLMLAHPTSLGGPEGEFTNPEQLFAAGYAGCFHSALKRMAAQGEGRRRRARPSRPTSGSASTARRSASRSPWSGQLPDARRRQPART